MSISDLPCDIESEILSRVPTKSLANLQTVCKRWNTLFRDPNFVKRNLGKSAKEMIFLKNRRRLYSINVNLLDQSMEFRGKLEVDQMYDICQCEGLIICETNTGLVVWNPCTGETTRIKPRRYKSSDIFALGYENSCHSYKILKLSCLRKINQEFYTDVFEIYEHSSDSWRDLDVKTHKCCILSRGVSLKGKAYWIASDKEAPSDEFILSFDFKTERFRRLSVPYQSDNHGARVVLSGFREQQLSVLRQNVHVFLFEIEIWVADNNIDEANEVLWNKYLVVDHVKFSIGGLRWVTSFLLDQENKVAVCCSTDLMINGEWKTKIHIVGEDMHKQVYKEIKEGSDQPFLLSYVPSLVHVHTNNP